MTLQKIAGALSGLYSRVTCGIPPRTLEFAPLAAPESGKETRFVLQQSALGLWSITVTEREDRVLRTQGSDGKPVTMQVWVDASHRKDLAGIAGSMLRTDTMLDAMRPRISGADYALLRRKAGMRIRSAHSPRSALA